MKRVQISIILSVLFLGVLQVSAKEVTIDELNKWVVVTKADAIESEKYAAEEFRSIYKLAAGVSLKTAEAVPANGGYILIGQSDAVKTDDLGEEGLRIVIDPKHIIITGGRPRGVLYGVYEFFETYLDVQFLSTDHTYVPENKAETKIPCETYSYVTPFNFRWSYFAENNTNYKFATRMRTNTIQSEPRFGKNSGYNLINHSFHRHLPIKKYGKTNPEYFMMRNGRRDVDYKDTWGLGPNPCYDSKGALDVITQSAMDYFAKNPARKNVSLSCVDSHAYCQCKECAKVNKAHGGTSGSHFNFINKVARRMKDKYPDKFIGSLAYYHTRHAPTNMKMEDNVQIQLCSIECCTHHAIDDPNCPKNISFYKDMKDWSKICKNIMIWNYNVDFCRYDMPFPNLKSIGPNVKFFRDNNAKGVFMQSAGNSRNSSMSDLKNWVISQCLWKPDADSWELTKKFCKMHYAESAGPIIEWLSLLHDHVTASKVHYNCFPSAKDMNLTPEMGIKALELFKKAMELAKSDAVRSRVEKASICAYRLIIDASPYSRVGDTYKFVFPVGYENTIEEYKRLAKKHKTDRATERDSIDSYLKVIEGRKIVTLENKFWKIELLPSWNAKIIEVVYKPRKLKLIQNELTEVRVRFPWEERGVKCVKSELRRNYVLTYKVDFQTSDSIILSTVLADGSKIQRKVWLDKNKPEKICFSTEVTHNADKPKEYQFVVKQHFYAESIAGKKNSFSTLVSHLGQYVDLNKLTGGKLPVKQNFSIKKSKRGESVVFNNRDNFGLQIRYDNLIVETPYIWHGYYVFVMQTEKLRLKKGQSMSWDYSLTPVKENPVK